MNDPDIQVGKVVRIDPDEARVLKENGAIMEYEAASRHPGWFLRYMQAHKRALGAIRQVINRSHGLGH